jgi:hypothetical protein
MPRRRPGQGAGAQNEERRPALRSASFWTTLVGMNEKIANILEQVHDLSAADRAELIEALTGVAEAEVFDPAYLKEIEERLAAYDRGEVQGLDAYEIAFRRPSAK